MPEAALDVAAVKEELPVLGAEAKRTLRPRARLVAPVGAGERPCERVVAEDRRALGARCTGQRHRLRRSDAVIGAELRRFEVGPEPVRDEQPLDRTNRRELGAGFAPSTGASASSAYT